jgi:hypothetical protein
MPDTGQKIPFKDFGEATSWERTPEGYLKVNASIAKPGIQDYFAGELPRQLLPQALQGDQGRVVKLLRPVDEVFRPESMDSFNLKPVTNDHPPEFVDSTNFSRYQIGMALGPTAPKDGVLNTQLLIQDAKSIEQIEGGKRQVSAGYDAGIVWDAGIDAVHGPYDGKQISIVANHVAIVDKGRAGAAIQINDSWKSQPEKGDEMGDVTRDVGGLSVKFSDQGAQAIDSLLASLDVETAKSKDLAVKLTDAEKKIDELQGKLDVEESNRFTDAQIEELVNARVALADRVKTLCDVECGGKAPMDIKKEVIAKMKDGFSLEGKSDDYINAVFDMLEPPKQTDQGLQTMAAAITDASTVAPVVSPIEAARKELNAYNAEGWKQEVK